MPTEGTLTLYVRDEQVGEGKILTQPGKFGLGGGGLVVGRSGRRAGHRRLRRRRHRGRSSAARSSGSLIDVSGEPFVDLAQEARAAFAHQ